MRPSWKLFVLALTLAAIGAAQAPQLTGTIQGDLVDSTGGAVPGAKVRAMSQASGASRSAVSDAAGHFRLAGLPAGSYTLQLDLDGFAPVHVEAFPLPVGQTVTHRIEMKPAHVIEKIEVKGQPDALDATATTAAATASGCPQACLRQVTTLRRVPVWPHWSPNHETQLLSV